MHLIFVGQGYPQKLFNLEHFPIHGSTNYLSYIKTASLQLFVLHGLLVSCKENRLL